MRAGAVAMLLMLAGCAAAYEPAANGIGGQVADEEVQAGVWRVRFAGMAATSRDTAESYWLYEAASLTLGKGLDGFEILTPMSFARVDRHPVRLAMEGGGFALPAIGGRATDTPEARGPQVEGDIRLLKRPFAAMPPKSFDAGALKAALEPVVTGRLCDGNVCPHGRGYLK